MFNLGIVNDENKVDMTLDNLLKLENYKVSIVEKKEQIQQLDGLVISMKTKKNIASVIDWLLACQTKPNVFVWIFSEVPLESELMILMSLGANDVVTSTINLHHLSIVIKNTFSRLKNHIIENPKPNSVELLNENNQTVYINGSELSLTKKEFDLLHILYKNPNMTVRYEELMERLWTNKPKDNTFLLANIVFHLRDKTKKSKDFEIETTRAKGYMLRMKSDAIE